MFIAYTNKDISVFFCHSTRNEPVAEALDKVNSGSLEQDHKYWSNDGINIEGTGKADFSCIVFDPLKKCLFNIADGDEPHHELAILAKAIEAYTKLKN